jgi:hypothetical protein
MWSIQDVLKQVALDARVPTVLSSVHILGSLMLQTHQRCDEEVNPDPRPAVTRVLNDCWGILADSLELFQPDQDPMRSNPHALQVDGLAPFLNRMAAGSFPHGITIATDRVSGITTHQGKALTIQTWGMESTQERVAFTDILLRQQQPADERAFGMLQGMVLENLLPHEMQQLLAQVERNPGAGRPHYLIIVSSFGEPGLEEQFATYHRLLLQWQLVPDTRMEFVPKCGPCQLLSGYRRATPDELQGLLGEENIAKHEAALLKQWRQVFQFYGRHHARFDFSRDLCSILPLLTSRAAFLLLKWGAPYGLQDMESIRDWTLVVPMSVARSSQVEEAAKLDATLSTDYLHAFFALEEGGGSLSFDPVRQRRASFIFLSNCRAAETSVLAEMRGPISGQSRSSRPPETFAVLPPSAFSSEEEYDVRYRATDEPSAPAHQCWPPPWITSKRYHDPVAAFGLTEEVAQEFRDRRPAHLHQLTPTPLDEDLYVWQDASSPDGVSTIFWSAMPGLQRQTEKLKTALRNEQARQPGPVAGDGGGPSAQKKPKTMTQQKLPITSQGNFCFL